ncbi:MAG TPA: FAD-dependent oxidoreductase [Longimicrobiales bacterium]
MKRAIDALGEAWYDVLVIGAGIVGACIARDAALRGLRVALVDRSDVGCGASANCLKIVHGGLRYLQHLDVRRMRASIRERSAWLRIAPHLVEPLPFVLPIHGKGLERRAVFRAALALNDALSWDRNEGIALERRLPRGRILSREECLSLAPQLDAPGLEGGALIYDAQMYSPERLVLEVVRDACAAGAAVANYVAFEAPLYRGGRLAGGRLFDRVGGRRIDVRARLVVSAAGSAAAEVARRLTGRDRAVPPCSLALNLVAPALGPAVGFAVAGAGEAGRGRKLFIAPWRGRTLVGTGHYAYAGDPFADAAERYVDRFLAEVNRALPDWGLSRADILVVHRGRVPLERRARRGEPTLLRHHRIVDHAADGVPEAITVVAEKFTTARGIAEEVVDLVFRKLGRPSPECVTARVPLPGAAPSPAALLAEARRRFGARLDRETLEHLTRAYGRRYALVLGAGAAGGVGAIGLDPRAARERQFVYAAWNEMACRPEDLLERRTELGPRGVRDPHAERLAREVLARRDAAMAPVTSARAADAPAMRASVTA